MKRLVITAAALSVLGTINTAQAQSPGDIFNGTPSAIPGTNAAESALNQAGADPGNFKMGDFTDDEKRMQHKYRDSIKHAKELVSKGSTMMEHGKKTNNDKEFKKGKIFKEIGDRQLGELNANNPFPPPEEKAKSESPEVAEATPSTEKPKKEKRKFGLPLIGKKKQATTKAPADLQTSNDQ